MPHNTGHTAWSRDLTQMESELSLLGAGVHLADMDTFTPAQWDNGQETPNLNAIDTLHERSLTDPYSYTYGGPGGPQAFDTTENIDPSILDHDGQDGGGTGYPNGPKTFTIGHKQPKLIGGLDLHLHLLENAYDSTNGYTTSGPFPQSIKTGGPVGPVPGVAVGTPSTFQDIFEVSTSLGAPDYNYVDNGPSGGHY